MPRDGDEVGGGPKNSALRTLHFWRRAGAVYAAYKAAQVKAFALRARGWDAARLTAEHWQPHHAWAGNEFYSMAVDLRGFYLKVNSTTSGLKCPSSQEVALDSLCTSISV